MNQSSLTQKYFIDTYHVDMEHEANLRQQEVQQGNNRLMEIIKEDMKGNKFLMEGHNNVNFSVNRYGKFGELSVQMKC